MTSVIISVRVPVMLYLRSQSSFTLDKMAPTPRTCMVPGCEMGPEGGSYVKDSVNRRREEVKEDMNEHRKDHELTLKTIELNQSAGIYDKPNVY